MLVVATAISGSEEKGYFERFMKYCERRGKRVVHYDVGKMLFEHAERRGVRMTHDKVLNTNPHAMDERKAAVFESILADIRKKKPQGYSFVVSMHFWFYWKYRYEPAIDAYYIRELDPDLYVTFLNDVDSIEKNLRGKKQWEFLFGQDKHPMYGRNKILDWQSVEVGSTASLAKGDPKRLISHKQPSFFVIPSKATETILYRLMFEQWRKKFYLGMPLTLFHDPKYAYARKRIDQLKAWLEPLIIAVDPRYVEPLSKKHLNRIDPQMYHNVVHRDLYWLIPQTDGMIAFFPEVAFSAGVNNELREVHETNGETILIYPPNKPASPFLTEWADKILRSEEAFKKHFREYLGAAYLGKVVNAKKN